MRQNRQETKKQNRFEFWHRTLCIMAAVMFLFCIVRAICITEMEYRGQNRAQHVDSAVGTLRQLDDGWFRMEDEETRVSVALPSMLPYEEESITIYRDINGLFGDGEVLLLDNMRQSMVIALDGEVIYKINTSELLSQLQYTDYQIVPIHPAKRISITISHPLTENFELPEILYGTESVAHNLILRRESVSFVLLSVMSVISLVILALGIGGSHKRLSDSRIFDLYVFLVTAILWGFTDSYLAVLTPIPEEVLGVVCYLTLAAIPMPMEHFTWISGGRRGKLLPVMTMICAVNLTLQGLLSMLGIVQLQDTFFISHILVVVVIVAAIYYVLKNKINEGRNVEYDIVFAGLCVLSLTAVSALILYWFIGGASYRICMLSGIFVFVLSLTGAVVYHFGRMMHDNAVRLSEMKLQEKLAMIDALTGLQNRRAFENKMEEVDLHADEYREAVLIMMDLNGLKVLNDKYGHSAGDDLIAEAASVLRQVYEPSGECYRIGGDEFCVVLLNPEVDLSVYEDRLHAAIDRVNENHRWKMSIARGFSRLHHPEGQRLTISDWKQEADVNMYRSKVAMTGSRNRDRAKDLRDIIDCIISTVEAKDIYTSAHSERVRELASFIGEQLGVSNLTMENLETAAYLHDIGKIGVPDSVLMKPAGLTDSEYEQIKWHATIGADIIGKAKGFQEVSTIIRHHHERWDGHGYPSGLEREDIPLESRVIAIADSIDAMTSKRVYRDSLSIDECRAEIERNAGLMYDPAIAAITLQHWKELTDIILLHPKRLIHL